MRDTAVWQRPAALLLLALYLGCDPQVLNDGHLEE
jgi:hypothetical protein